MQNEIMNESTDPKDKAALNMETQVTNSEDADANITDEELSLLDNANDETPDDNELQKAQLDDVDEEGDLLNEEDDLTGEDLDVPGSGDDDADEDLGEEDEENNYYSESEDREDEEEDDTQNG